MKEYTMAAKNTTNDAERANQPAETPDFGAVPGELKARRQWVNWRFEKRNGEWTKVPYQPSGQHARTDDLETWAAFDEARDALAGGNFSGIGFVFCEADPYCGVDLDKCRNPETGELAPWAREVLATLPGYREASPSRDGVHIITRGVLPRSMARIIPGGGKIEAYTKRRYFTVTGVAL
jgi:primase-polymerase (primpol)-like protein